jgi:hypothetical protein
VQSTPWSHPKPSVRCYAAVVALSPAHSCMWTSFAVRFFVFRTSSEFLLTIDQERYTSLSLFPSGCCHM